MLFWKSNWWDYLLFFLLSEAQSSTGKFYVFVCVCVCTGYVLPVPLGACLCCCSDCCAATKKLLNNVNSVFGSEIFFLFPKKSELLPVFPCSPLVALQAPLFSSALARELPQFQQQGRCLPSHLLVSWTPELQTNFEREIRELLYDGRQRQSKQQGQKWTF